MVIIQICNIVSGPIPSYKLIFFYIVVALANEGTVLHFIYIHKIFISEASTIFHNLPLVWKVLFVDSENEVSWVTYLREKHSTLFPIIVLFCRDFFSFGGSQDYEKSQTLFCAFCVLFYFFLVFSSFLTKMIIFRSSSLMTAVASLLLLLLSFVILVHWTCWTIIGTEVQWCWCSIRYRTQCRHCSLPVEMQLLPLFSSVLLSFAPLLSSTQSKLTCQDVQLVFIYLCKLLLFTCVFSLYIQYVYFFTSNLSQWCCGYWWILEMSTSRAVVCTHTPLCHLLQTPHHIWSICSCQSPSSWLSETTLSCLRSSESHSQLFIIFGLSLLLPLYVPTGTSCNWRINLQTLQVMLLQFESHPEHLHS